jgi:cysteine desulfurase/selenocysteine lyase
MSTLEQSTIDRARSDTPGCTVRIHANNGGAALQPTAVINAVSSYAATEAIVGGYETQDLYSEQLAEVYRDVASLIGASASEIAITDSASRAWQLMFQAIPLCEGDRLLTSRTEYGTNYLTMLRRAELSGAVVEFVPDDEYGQISVGALESMMDDNVKAVCLTHVPTNSGLVQPAEAVGKVVSKWPAYYILDAAQSVGQLPVSVADIGCDLLATAGRKYLRGPRGTGFIYASSTVIEDLVPALVDLQSADWTGEASYEFWPDARRFESWEFDCSGRMGLGAAARYAQSFDQAASWVYIKELGDHLRSSLRELSTVTVHERGQELSGAATFSVAGYDSEAVWRRLTARGINTYPVSSHYARLDMEPRGLKDVVRAGMHYYNTHDEVDTLVREVGKL